MGSQSEEYVANFARGNVQAAQPQPKQGSAGSTTGQAGAKGGKAVAGQAQAQAGGGVITPNVAAARQRVAAAGRAGQAQAAALRAQQQAQEEAEAAADISGTAVGFGVNMAEGWSERLSGLRDWAASLPTPGGIVVLLIAIFVLLWAVIPVNKEGDTRLVLLWYTITGRTMLHGSPEEVVQQAAGGLFPFSQNTPAATTSAIAGVGSVFNVNVPIEDFSSNGQTPTLY